MTARTFTVYVDERLPLAAMHPNPHHHRRLLRVAAGLERDHALGWCGGCEWFLRWPTKDISTLNRRVMIHLTHDHFDALVHGTASLDPDLVDGGEEYLRARLGAVHRFP